jgi:hypothetical protein
MLLWERWKLGALILIQGGESLTLLTENAYLVASAIITTLRRLAPAREGALASISRVV